MAQCFLSFPSWMPPEVADLLCRLREAQASVSYPEGYCHCLSSESDNSKEYSTRFLGDGHNLYQWAMDLKKYRLHPSSVYNNGWMGYAKQFSDDHGKIMAVTKVEICGNGDADKILGDEGKFGNIYFTLSGGMCKGDWSPPIHARSRDMFKSALEELAQRKADVGRDEMGAPHDIDDLKKNGENVVTILPGPYPSHRPGGYEYAPNDQCEFGQQCQSIEYEPQGKPVLDIDDRRLPVGLVNQPYYCARVMESDGCGLLCDDDVLMQFTISSSESYAAGAITYAYDPAYTFSVLKGLEAENTPSILKITITMLKEVTDPLTWGRGDDENK